MIKQSRITLVAALAAVGLAVPSLGMAASATASSSSTVVTPITITKSADLAFGKFAAGTQSIYVGGVLTVGSGQAPGTYTGSVVASVDYN